jgi:hypothetical protein
MGHNESRTIVKQLENLAELEVLIVRRLVVSLRCLSSGDYLVMGH